MQSFKNTIFPNKCGKLKKKRRKNILDRRSETIFRCFTGFFIFALENTFLNSYVKSTSFCTVFQDKDRHLHFLAIFPLCRVREIILSRTQMKKAKKLLIILIISSTFFRCFTALFIMNGKNREITEILNLVP